NGDGTLAPAVNYAVDSSPRALSVTDLNGDGIKDLVVVANGAGTLSVLLGNGDGTFASAVSYPTGYSPNSIAISDFNGDGFPDVVVSTSSNNSLALLLGNGNGTLRAASSFPGYYNPSSIIAGDFNGDGTTDLVYLGNSYYLALQPGNGDGTFQAPITIMSGIYATFVVAGDFNGDGRPDLATTNYYSGSLSILLSTGGGLFASAVTYPIPYGGSSLAIDDLNGDGKPDVIVASSASSTLSLLLGSGNGLFQPAFSYPASYGLTQILVGDFNADGKPDVAGAPSYDNRVAIMLGGCADLTIAKSHFGHFLGGQSNATYSLTVSDSSGAARGLVTVIDALPSGLTATAMNGPGWNCNLPNLTCTRSDSVAAGSSYPSITLTVDVSKTAPTNITNTATVSGGSDTNTANNSASDPTIIDQVADLTITKTHEGSFAQGQNGRTYTISVSNSGGGPTTGTVTVTDTLPPGLSATAMAGPGWSCDLPARTCTRTDSLPVNASYPAITLTVNVDSNCPANLTNVANVWGGGEAYFANDTANDPTRILTTATNLLATAISTSQVSLTWDPVANAANYQVLRSSSNGPYTIVDAEHDVSVSGPRRRRVGRRTAE
ncbi:MAG: FG-GAP-like repeat-containing protein, partial [Acidobacteriota bacterium]